MFEIPLHLVFKNRWLIYHEMSYFVQGLLRTHILVVQINNLINYVVLETFA